MILGYFMGMKYAVEELKKERLFKLGLQSNIEKNHYVSGIEFHYWRQKNSPRTAERGNSALCS